jgi:hypothetical protein
MLHPLDSPNGSLISSIHGLLGFYPVDLLERQVYGSHIKTTSVSEARAVQQLRREAQPRGSLRFETQAERSNVFGLRESLT